MNKDQLSKLVLISSPDLCVKLMEIAGSILTSNSILCIVVVSLFVLLCPAFHQQIDATSVQSYLNSDQSQ